MVGLLVYGWGLVFVDAENALLVHVGELWDEAEPDSDDVDGKLCGGKVGVMARDEKEDNRSGGKELAGGCKLLPVVDLLPLRQIVILALVERKRRPLHPMPCHKRDLVIHRVSREKKAKACGKNNHVTTHSVWGCGVCVGGCVGVGGCGDCGVVCCVRCVV